MFTGIVEEIGQVISFEGNKLAISCSNILDDIKLGDSVAVNGVCLTVTDFQSDFFGADVSFETNRVTKELKSGDYVNLERAMLATSRFGGHIVSGHIDILGKVVRIDKLGEFYNLEVSFDDSMYAKYIVQKGSVTIDGISLTIYKTTSNSFSIAVIPHTFENTNLKYLKLGANVNIEFDILAKYVEKNLLIKDNKSSITKEMLLENGFI